MSTCPVCGAVNDPLAVICVQCKGYLQGRVEALNLFETVWGLVESPGATFRRIVLARHKNYVVLLSGAFGIALVYALLWYRHLGNLIADPVVLGGAALVLGPPLGVAAVGLFAAAMTWLARVQGGKATFRTTHAVAAYATVPIVLALVLLFPVELAVFGFDLFRTNPHPMLIKPVAYTILLGLDACAIIWSWILILEGSVVANGFTRLRAARLVLTLLILCAAALLPLGLL